MRYKYIGFLCCCLVSNVLFAQTIADRVYATNVKTPLLYQQNNPLSLPVLQLNSSDLLELHFDDLDANVKNYYYCYQLCNADWQPAQVNTFDYIKGYLQQRLTQYRISSIAQVRYMHYQATLPDKNCMPTKSGNYLLKVFLNGDTSQLVFFKRMYVLDRQASIAASVVQPFSSKYFKTHQRLQMMVNLGKLNAVGVQQQVTTMVMQNNRCDKATINLQPTFVRENVLEFSGDLDCVFAAGKEYRWVDLRSLRLASERIASFNQMVIPVDVQMRADYERQNSRYLFYPDFNGNFYIDGTENINPHTQGDYGLVHFYYVPAGNQQLVGSEVHLMGAFTSNTLSDSSLMRYNTQSGAYEKTLLLKQGFYSYAYATKPMGSNRNIPTEALSIIEGDYWETENDYTVFVYYRSLSGRHDELVGMTTVNSRNQRIGN